MSASDASGKGFEIYSTTNSSTLKCQAGNDVPAVYTTGTVANVQKFVDAYNALLTSIKTLTAAGDHTVVQSSDANATPSPTAADAAFYNDAGVTNLRDRLSSALRAVTGGKSLISFGISAGRDGTLTVDAGRLNKAVAANPGSLDTLFGRAGTGVQSGVMGAMDKIVSGWTSAGTGLIATRQLTNSKQQSDITLRQANVQSQFDNAYKRYLAQFTALQQLQSSMTSTSNMFTAMFSSSSSS
ncbi:MAG: flagellar filament capping protein FliD [Pseudomonadota bacterium]